MNNINCEDTYNALKDIHDETFNAVERGIKLEEEKNPELALHEYKKAAVLVDRALNISVKPQDELKEKLSEEWNMLNKLRGARKDILIRIASVDKHIITNKASTSQTEVNAENTRPRTHIELVEALHKMQHNVLSSAESLELLFSCDNVKYYRINTTGEVTIENTESTLRVLFLEKDVNKKLDSTIFLQVIKTSQAIRIESVEPQYLESIDEQQSNVTDNVRVSSPWIYPLIPGVTPCFRTEYGAFIFPDSEANDGSAIGLVIPEGSDDIVLEILVHLLKGVMKQGGMIEFGDLPTVNDRVPATVTNTFVKGASYVSKGLVYSAEKTGDFLSYSTPYLISKLQKAPSQDQQHVPENVRSGMDSVKAFTGKASSITGNVANKVSSSTMSVGRYLAPRIQKHGSWFLSGVLGFGSQDAEEHVTDILTVCAGAVEGVGTVYTGLEDSAGILGKSLSENTVKVVEHKYGSEVGKTVDDGFDTVGNVIHLSKNVNFLSPKGIASRTARGAGKSLVSEFLPGTDASGFVLPDLTGLEKEIVKKNE